MIFIETWFFISFFWVAPNPRKSWLIFWGLIFCIFFLSCSKSSQILANEFYKILQIPTNFNKILQILAKFLRPLYFLFYFFFVQIVFWELNKTLLKCCLQFKTHSVWFSNKNSKVLKFKAHRRQNCSPPVWNPRKILANQSKIKISRKSISVSQD